MNHESLINQLVSIYLEEENWHRKKLDREEAKLYFAHLLSKGNIITVEHNNVLCGYLEFWRLTYEQFGRVLCQPLSAMQEDVQTGYISYLANIYIKPEYRDSQVFNRLRDRFFEANASCTYFVGEERSKRNGAIKVFNRSDIWEKSGNLVLK